LDNSLGSTRDVIGEFLDPKTLQNVNEIWGYNDEMEFIGIYGDTGVPNLWYMTGKIDHKTLLLRIIDYMPLSR
jgi:hypothetical protein